MGRSDVEAGEQAVVVDAVVAADVRQPQPVTEVFVAAGAGRARDVHGRQYNCAAARSVNAVIARTTVAAIGNVHLAQRDVGRIAKRNAVIRRARDRAARSVAVKHTAGHRTVPTDSETASGGIQVDSVLRAVHIHAC